MCEGPSVFWLSPLGKTESAMGRNIFPCLRGRVKPFTIGNRLSYVSDNFLPIVWFRLDLRLFHGVNYTNHVRFAVVI